MLRTRIISPGLAPFRLIVRLATVLTVIGLGTRPASGLERMHVSMGDNTIVRYDVSLSRSSAVSASANTFVNTGQGMNSPFGLAFDMTGNLYAANQGTNTITRYDTMGNRIGTDFIGMGLNLPRGLAFDPGGNFHVTNQGNSIISKYDAAGVFQFSWSTSAQPHHLAFVPEPSTYVLGAIATGLLAVIARRRKGAGRG